MPTSIETSFAPKESTPEPMESTFKSIKTVDSRLTDIIAFPSLNSSLETASNVPSAHEEPPTERMITACTNFRHYGIWLKKNFFEKITSMTVYFVIKSLELPVPQI